MTKKKIISTLFGVVFACVLLLADTWLTGFKISYITGSSYGLGNFSHLFLDIFLGIVFGMILYAGWDFILDMFNININLDNLIPFKKSISSPSKDKQRAMYPRPDKRLLVENIDGKSFILGSFKDKFVGFNLDKRDVRNICLIGAPGTGKSVSIISNLIPIQKNKTATIFAFDIKPELCYKSNYIDADDVRYVDPTSNIGCGWNVFYELGDNPATADIDKIINVLDTISRSLIEPGSKDNLVFSESARNIFIGACAYGIRKGRGFVECINALLHEPLPDFIYGAIKDNKIEDAEIIQSYLAPYEENNETNQSINVTLRQSLNVFMKKNVRYKLQDCSIKASPLDLLNDINVYIAMPDYELKEYAPILRLIATQVMNELGKTSDVIRSSDNAKPIILLIDEFGSIGQIPNIFDALARFRSRQIYVILALQNLHQVSQTYSEVEAKMCWDLCVVKMILSNSDDWTSQLISNLSGKYRESKTSLSSKGDFLSKDKSNTYSEEYRPIVEANDLLTLSDKAEIIVFTKEGYNRLDRCNYYLIDDLNNISKDCVRHNQEVINKENTRENG